MQTKGKFGPTWSKRATPLHEGDIICIPSRIMEAVVEEVAQELTKSSHPMKLPTRIVKGIVTTPSPRTTKQEHILEMEIVEPELSTQ